MMTQPTQVGLRSVRSVVALAILLLLCVNALFISANSAHTALGNSDFAHQEQTNGTIPDAVNVYLPVTSGGASRQAGQAEPTDNSAQVVATSDPSTPTPTATTSTPTATESIQPSITATPTLFPTDSVDETVSPTPDGVQPTQTQTSVFETPTIEATETPTVQATISPTEGAAPSPTVEETAAPTVEVTATFMPEPTATDQPDPTPAGDISFTIGMTATQTIQTDGLSLRYLAVYSVFLASQTANTGQAVTTGTLDIIDESAVNYDAQPADRLVVNLADGRTFTAYVSTITGSNTSDPDSFLGNTHQLDMRVVTSPLGPMPDPNVNLPPNVDLQLTSTLENDETTITLNGQMESAIGPVTVDLTFVGSRFFESSFGGTEDRSNSTLIGTVVGANFDITVDEAYANTRVVFEGESASTADADIRNSWTVNGISYAIQNGIIRRSFRDGFVNENELSTRWQAAGDLLRNGQNVGRLQLNISSNFVDVVVTADGNIYRLQRFMRP